MHEIARAETLQNVDIALDQRGLGDQTNGLVEIGCNFQQLPRELEFSFARLVGINIDAKADHV